MLGIPKYQHTNNQLIRFFSSAHDSILCNKNNADGITSVENNVIGKEQNE